MKNILIIVVFLIGIISGNAQTINYQAALKDNRGQVMANQQIDFRIRLLDESGTSLFEEEHLAVETNGAGIFNLRIGSINSIGFEKIDFGQGIQIATEINTASGYEDIGQEYLAAVPMAYHAKTVENADDDDADPTNELQQISFDSMTNKLMLTDGGVVDLSSLEHGAGSHSNTDDQKLSISGTELTIENGNSIDLSSIKDGVNDADADPQNEIQKITKQGNKIRLSIAGGEVIDEVNDADANPKNEIQQLSMNKNTKRLSLTGGGGSVDLSDVFEHHDSYWNKENNGISYPGEIQVLKLSTTMYGIDVGEHLKVEGSRIKSTDDLQLSTSEYSYLDINSSSNLGPIRIGFDKITRINTGEGRVMIGDGSPTAKLHVSTARSNRTAHILKLSNDEQDMVFDSDMIQVGKPSQPLKMKINPEGGKIQLGPLGSDSELRGTVSIPNGNGGIGLQITKGNDANLNDHSGFLVLGHTNGKSIVIDDDEIQARRDGQPASLVLNNQGGRLYCGGLRDIGDHANMQYNTSTKEIGYDNSSRRFKTNITTLQDDWKKILNARPVRYDRPSTPNKWEYGYIAEEMDSIGLSNLVFYDQEGLPDNFNYEKMILYLTEVIKIHENDNLELRTRVEELEKIIRSKVLQIPH